jgi:hypothetical protein
VFHAPERPSLDELRAQSVQGLERHIKDLQRYTKREQQIDRRQGGRAWRDALAGEQVLAAGKAHGLPRDYQAEQMVTRLERSVHAKEVAQQIRGLAQEHDESGVGSRLRVQLFDREEEREREWDRGYGW